MTAVQRDSIPATEAYPHDAPVEARLRFALRFAVLAPSSHNSQPWLFRIEGDHVDLLADRTRALAVVDPHDRELVISCGAALHHLRTALAAFGEKTEAQLHAVRRGRRRARARGGAAGGRSTTRGRASGWRRRRAGARRGCPSSRATVSTAAHRPRLGGDPRTEGAALHVLEDDMRRAVVRLVAEADHEQMADASFRRELASWMHGNRTAHRDGMPGYAHGLGDVLAAVGPAVVRTFDLGKAQAAKDVGLAEHSPILALVSTGGDSVLDWLHAGQALSALLLDATAVGLSASFLNQPIEVPKLRDELGGLFAPGTVPQLLLRLGVYAGEPPRPTPRRPLEEVLVK